MDFYSQQTIGNPNLTASRDLSRESAAEILWMLATEEPLIKDDSFERVVQSFKTPSPIDTYAVVGAMARTPVMGKLLSGKTGVRESYRLHEHTQAVLNGFDSDYIQQVDDSDRKLIRTALFAQDIGKSLCIAYCGNRREQAPYNAAAVDNLLAAVSETTLDSTDKQTIRLLLAQDFLGRVLKGYNGVEESTAHQQISELGRHIPARHTDRYRHFMRIIYMSDVSAYTDFRSYVAAEDGRTVQCISALNKEYEVLDMQPSGRVEFKDPARNAMLDRLTVSLESIPVAPQ